MRQKLTLLNIALLVFTLSACSLLPRNKEPIADDQSNLVARDFAGALSLLRGYSPRNTMLQLRPAKTRFGRSLERALRAEGYGLQLVPEKGTGAMLVTYQVDAFENETGRSVGYRLRAGSVELAREYEIRGERVFPMTSLSVKGVEIASRPLDHSIFDRNRASLEEKGQTENAIDELLLPQNQELLDGRGAESLFIQRTKSLRQRALGSAQDWRSIASTKKPPLTTERLSVAAPMPRNKVIEKSSGENVFNRKQNMLDLGESNFASVLQDYAVQASTVLVFDNDSLRLGPKNKDILLDMADQYNARTDLFSLIGCSHGPSSKANGNEYLAIGRANRVKEELIYANVSASNILDEGCWAPTSQNDLPARGVIVRILRRT